MDSRSTKRDRFWPLGAVLSGALFLSACGGGDGDSSGSSDASIGAPDGAQGFDGGTGEVDHVLVEPEGGRYSLWNGDVTLDVPPGAVVEPITLTAERLSAPAGLGIVPGTMFDFGPDKTEFLQPLTVELRFDPEEVDGPVDALRIVKLVDGALDEQPTLTVAEGRSVVSGQVDGFSAVGIAGGCRALAPPVLSTRVNPRNGGVTVTWRAPTGIGSNVEIQRAVVSAGAPCSCLTPRRRGCIDSTASPGQCILNGLHDPLPSEWRVQAFRSVRDGAYLDRSAASAGVYSYRARYVRTQHCNAPWTPAVKAIVLGRRTLPSTAPSVGVQPLSCGGFRLSWSSVFEASGYEIQRRVLGSGQAFETIASTAGTRLDYVDTDPQLVPGERYEYRVSGTNEAGPGPADIVSAVNADSAFSLSLSHNDVLVPPGTNHDISVGIRRHGFQALDVELAFEVDIPRSVEPTELGITPVFFPRVAGGDSVLRFEVGPGVGTGVEMQGRVIATGAGSAGTCESPPIRLQVGEPFCRVQVPDVSINSEGTLVVDTFVERGGFGGRVELGIESTDPILPLAELGVRTSFIPNPTLDRSSLIFDTFTLPGVDYRGSAIVSARSVDDPRIRCESEIGIDVAQRQQSCDDPLTVELIVGSGDPCETTFDFEGQTYRAFDFPPDVNEVYLYPESSRPVRMYEWDLAVQDLEAPNYRQEVRFGQDVRLLRGGPIGVAIRVTDECDATAEDVIVVMSGDGVCDG